MNTTTDVLAQVASDLRAALAGDGLAGRSDADRAEVLRGLGEVTRLVEAVTVETVATADVEFGHRYGCRNMNELLQRGLLTDATTAAKTTRAADAVRREVNLVSGERMPARWPSLREALLAGDIGVAGLLAAIGPIEAAHDRISLAERLQIDEALARYACGLPAAEDEADSSGDDAAHPNPPATPDDLRIAAQYLAMVLDPDGAEPADRAAQSGRYLTIGRQRNGGFPIKGNLTPEVAAQLQLIFDAFNNPKVGGDSASGNRNPGDLNPGVAFEPTPEGPGDSTDSDDPFNSDPRNVIDPRTPAQKRHDALAAALGIAARHDEMPTLGGSAPTLVVHVDAADFAAGAGWATIPGCEGPVPLSVAAHTACTGAIQRVLFDEGRVVGITSTDRLFTVHQKRALIARDQECLIPGCHVSASWCEFHHVVEHARGGPTHTDNGVPLCWWHHRSLGQSGWEIRMANGTPEIRGPAWWDPLQQWRTPRPTLESLGLAATRAGRA